MAASTNGLARGPGLSLDPEALVGQSRVSLGPWPSEHLVRLLVANGLGLGLIITGAYQASRGDSVRTDLAWLNLAVAGLVVAGVANGLWLLRGRQVLTLARVAVLPSPATSSSGAVTGPVSSPVLVSGPAMAHYHRADCPLAAGKTRALGDRAAHEGAGLAPCEVCEP